MAKKQYRIADINRLDRDAFMAVFESVFEDSAWAAELVYEHLPFASVDSFTDRFCQCVSEEDDQAKLQLLCAHPELGSNRKMADASVKEQTGAGIRDTKQDHRSLIQELNALYRQQFDFPFIIAVKGLTPALIVEQMQQRLLNDRDTEFDECLKQVFKIARIRLDDILAKE
jgi:2-oxo-4-hydroxy-4-carboxy-5-ureidoimidazoline decarboxylase